jgi:ethanolamine transporter EutH
MTQRIAPITASMLRSIFGPVIDALVTGADPDTVSAASNVIATAMGFFNSGILIGARSSSATSQSWER